MSHLKIALSVLLLLGNYKVESKAPVSKIEIVNGKFRDSCENPFFPWGFNYTNPEKIGLIEDSWSKKETREIIAQDFQEMKELGANVIRIHLQYNKFMIDAHTPNLQALNILEQLVKVAEEKKIYLLITGLGAYTKSDQPDWYDNMNDEERWDTHKIFWRSIANYIGKYNSVFAYDLMNEPVMAVNCKEINKCEWIVGDAFGSYHFIQNISRNPDNKFHSTIVRWADELKRAIRSVDEKTLVTIGFLPLGDLKPFSGSLDFISTHIYPETGKIDDAIQFILNNQSNVPLVITETATLNCDEYELLHFLKQIENKYEGAIGHYFGKTPGEHSDTILIDILHKNAIEFFTKNNPTTY